MRVRVAFLDVVHVVGGDELEAEFPGPGNEMPIDLGLFGKAVILQFEVEVVRAQRLLEPINGFARLG